jgi:hypothetical protein
MGVKGKPQIIKDIEKLIDDNPNVKVILTSRNYWLQIEKYIDPPSDDKIFNAISYRDIPIIVSHRYPVNTDIKANKIVGVVYGSKR